MIGSVNGSSNAVNPTQHAEDAQAAAEAAQAAAEAAQAAAQAAAEAAEAEAVRQAAEAEAARQTHSDGHSSFEATNPFQRSPLSMSSLSSAIEAPPMPSAPEHHDPDALYEQIAAGDEVEAQTRIARAPSASEYTTPSASESTTRIARAPSASEYTTVTSPEVPAAPARAARPEEQEREIALRRAAREVSEGKLTFEDLDRQVADGTLTGAERDRVRDDGVAQWQAQQDREAAAARATAERERSALAERVSRGDVSFEQLDEMVAAGTLSRDAADQIGQEGASRWKARTEANFVKQASRGQLSDDEVARYVNDGHFTAEQIQGLRDEGAKLAERRADSAIVGDLASGALSQEDLASKVASGELTQQKADALLETASGIWQQRQDNQVVGDLASGALSQESLALQVERGELTQAKADQLLARASAVWQGREDDKRVGELAAQVSRGEVSLGQLDEMVRSGTLTQELADRARDGGVGQWRERTANEMIDKLVTGEASHDDLMRLVDEGHFTKPEAEQISRVAGEEWRVQTAESLVDRLSRGEVSDDEIAGYVRDGHFTEDQVGQLRGIASDVRAERETAEAQALAEAEAAAAATTTTTTDGPEPAVRPLSAEEAGRVGSGLQNGRAPAQAFWSQQGVETTRNRALEQGLIDRAQSEQNGQLARELVLREGVDPQSEAFTVGTGDLAAIARQSGIGVERLDVQQLQNAARYVNGASTRDEQASRLQNALDQLHMVDQGKKPQFTRDDVKGMAWDAARVGGHAIDRLNNQELQTLAGDLASRMNTPGDHKLKVGKHEVKFTVDAEQGYIDGSGSTRSTGGILGTLANVGRIALTAASFIPGPVGIVARVANSVIGAVTAARNGNVLGAIASAAGAVGGVAAGIGGRIADTVARVANATASGARAVQGAMTGTVGGILGGVAGAVGAAAQGIGNAASNVSQRLNDISRHLGTAGAAATAIQNRDVGGILSAGAAGVASAIDAAHPGDSRAAQVVRNVGASAGNVATGIQRRSLGAILQAGANAAATALELVGAPGAHAHAAGIVRDVGRNAGNVAGAIVRGDLVGVIGAGVEIGATVDARLGHRDRADLVRSAGQAGVNITNAARTGGDVVGAINAGVAGIGGTLQQQQQRRAAEEAAAREAQRQQLARAAGGTAAGATELPEAPPLRLPRPEEQAALDAAEQNAQTLEALKEQPRVTGGFAALVDDAATTLRGARDAYADAIAAGDESAIAAARQSLHDATAHAQERLRLVQQVTGPVELHSAAVGSQLEQPTTYTHAIQRGDRLERIAVQNGLTLQELLAANPGINPTGLKPGDRIAVPFHPSDPAAAARFAEGVANARFMATTPNANYTVKPGDTIQDILARHPHLTEADLRAVNPQLSPDGALYRGQGLVVPTRDQIVEQGGRRTIVTAADASRLAAGTQQVGAAIARLEASAGQARQNGSLGTAVVDAVTNVASDVMAWWNGTRNGTGNAAGNRNVIGTQQRDNVENAQQLRRIYDRMTENGTRSLSPDQLRFFDGMLRNYSGMQSDTARSRDELVNLTTETGVGIGVTIATAGVGSVVGIGTRAAVQAGRAGVTYAQGAAGMGVAGAALQVGLHGTLEGELSFGQAVDDARRGFITGATAVGTGAVFGNLAGTAGRVARGAADLGDGFLNDRIADVAMTATDVNTYVDSNGNLNTVGQVANLLGQGAFSSMTAGADALANGRVLEGLMGLGAGNLVSAGQASLARGGGSLPTTTPTTPLTTLTTLTPPLTPRPGASAPDVRASLLDPSVGAATRLDLARQHFESNGMTVRDDVVTIEGVDYPALRIESGNSSGTPLGRAVNGLDDRMGVNVVYSPHALEGFGIGGMFDGSRNQLLIGNLEAAELTIGGGVGRHEIEHAVTGRGVAADMAGQGNARPNVGRVVGGAEGSGIGGPYDRSFSFDEAAAYGAGMRVDALGARRMLLEGNTIVDRVPDAQTAAQIQRRTLDAIAAAEQSARFATTTSSQLAETRALIEQQGVPAPRFEGEMAFLDVPVFSTGGSILLPLRVEGGRAAVDAMTPAQVRELALQRIDETQASLARDGRAALDFLTRINGANVSTPEGIWASRRQLVDAFDATRLSSQAPPLLAPGLHPQNDTLPSPGTPGTPGTTGTTGATGAPTTGAVGNAASFTQPLSVRSQVLQRGFPLGFDSLDAFRGFSERAHGLLQSLGVHDANLILQGSAVTGRSAQTGARFDMGRTSDFDLAVASPGLFERARALGVRVKTDVGGGNRTSLALTPEQLDRLGLRGTVDRLTRLAGRPVSIVLFDDVRGPAGDGLVLPR